MKILKVTAGVRYYEDGCVDGRQDISWEEQCEGVKPRVPCVKLFPEEGKRGVDYKWCLEIDADTGIILNWEKGITAKVHYKVCDCCDVEYIVDGQKICDNESGKCCGYVPDILCPLGEGWGDYMIMNIDADGRIEKWNPDNLEPWVKKATSKDEEE